MRRERGGGLAWGRGRAPSLEIILRISQAQERSLTGLTLRSALRASAVRGKPRPFRGRSQPSGGRIPAAERLLTPRHGHPLDAGLEAEPSHRGGVSSESGRSPGLKLLGLLNYSTVVPSVVVGALQAWGRGVAPPGRGRVEPPGAHGGSPNAGPEGRGRLVLPGACPRPSTAS